MTEDTWPALIVEGGSFRIIGTGLLRDGRYDLVRSDASEPSTSADSGFDPRKLNRVPSPAEIEAGKSERGGFTRETMARWGVPWPPPSSGWRRALAKEHARRMQQANYELERRHE